LTNLELLGYRLAVRFSLCFDYEKLANETFSFVSDY